MPTVLLCASARDLPLTAFETAAARAGVTLHVITDAPAAPGHIPAELGRDGRHVRDVLDALAATPVDGVLAASDDAAWLASSLAQALGLPLHTPDAVHVAGDALLTRGRLLAAGLPVPWFVTVPASGDEDLDRLAQVRFPCQVRAAHLSPQRPAIRAESYEALMEARRRLAIWLARPEMRARTGADDTVIVEGVAPGQMYALSGTLELGALRVFALFERVPLDDDGVAADDLHVTPARLAPARQHVLAGHIARAALALGLHHGPITARCQVNDDDVVVSDVTPAPGPASLSRAIPVVSPARERCALEDALLAQALGRSLEHYGHQAIASGVLRRHASVRGTLAATAADVEVAQMPWVTGMARAADVGEAVAPPPEGDPVLGVFAQGAQPDDVIATLQQVAARLHVRVG